MAYIPYTYVPIAKSKKKKVRYTLPVGGVELSDTSGMVSDGKCSRILNLDIHPDRIKTRKVLTKYEDSFFASGKLNGACQELFCNRLVFHVGTCLYYFDTSESEPVLISDTLPDKKSLICHFLSKLYIYCGTYVYSLDNDFTLTEEAPPAAQIYDPMVPSFVSSIVRNDTPFNLVSPRIIVKYKSSMDKVFLVPHAIDTSRPVEIYNDGVLVDAGKLEINENKFTINDSYSVSNSREVSIVYYLLKPEEAGFNSFIENCRLVTAFGGNASGGTRLLFTGNSEKKGYYYKSELLDPLYVNGDDFEIIGNGNEEVTAIKKMYDYLVLFTENSLFRMSYHFTGDGTYFAVKEIGSEVGCDCPGSVQLVDNRIVFANSKRGVFIVDSTNEAGEQNIKPISGNIFKGKGVGFSDNPKNLLLNARSAEFDRKYMLFVGDRTYVWDYDKTPFYNTASYTTAQKRLCWYIYDGVNGSFFAEAGGKFISLYEDNGVYVQCFTESDGLETESVLESGKAECFSPHVRKHVTGMSIKLCREEESEIGICLYADGEKYYEMNLPKRKKAKGKLFLHLPRKAMYGFGFAIYGKGQYEIEEITAEYIEISE